MSGSGVKGRGINGRGPRGGRAPVYAAKALDADGATNAPGCWGGLVFNPPRLPHVECGGLGAAPPRSEFGQERTLKFFLHTGHSSKRSCYQHTKYSSVRTIIAYVYSLMATTHTESSDYF